MLASMSDVPSRLSAALQGRYDIERELGEGGMAKVYLAQDLRHERKVALKVLKPELAAVVGADRFLAEIKTTANLQHPHILPLFDSGEADGFLFYVMPHIEGESLRSRLDRDGQLPVSEAVQIAADLAEALDYAHRHDVVHRDIKPANILIHEGRPLIADFGIALAVGSAGADRLTETGLSVGTPYYMSPEQATGDQRVGPQSDLYALGCGLYEMLVGQPPHTGSNPQAVLAKIIQGGPVSAKEERASVPANVDAAIRRALEKMPADRFRSGAELVAALRDSAFRYGEAPWAADASRLWQLAAGGFALLSVVLAIALLRFATATQPAPEPLRLTLQLQGDFEMVVPPGDAPNMALSSDGTLLAYTGQSQAGDYQLWVRRRDAIAPSAISDTRLAVSPAISPDNSEIAFINGSGVFAVSVSGGSLRRLTDEQAQGALGMEWGADGFVYFVNPEGGVSRVPGEGGATETVIPAASGEVFGHPELLPDGKTLLLSRIDAGAGGPQELVLGNMESGAWTGLGIEGTAPVYVPTSHLVYADGQGLSAIAFDLGRLQPVGREETLVQDVAFFALSQTGTLVHRSALERSAVPVWVSRTGSVAPLDSDWVVTNPEDRESLAISPDGRSVALSFTPSGGITDVWTRPLDGSGAPSRLTIEGQRNYRPTWSPDSRMVTFISVMGDGRWIRTMPADGSRPAERVIPDDGLIDEVTYSHDGEWIVYRVGIGTVDRDIYAARVGTDSIGIPVVTTPNANDRAPALSPDDRWLAYTSDESGRDEIWVAPFPNPGGTRRQISARGGREPRWAHNGRELFYRNLEDELVRVEVTTGPSFTHGRQTRLFSVEDFLGDPNHWVYDVASDDQRFLMLQRRPGAGSVVWVENWFTELTQELEGR